MLGSVVLPLIFSAILAAAPNDAPPSYSNAPEKFDGIEAVKQWAKKTSFGGTWNTLLDYKGHKLFIVFRSQTSGIETSEPFVFVERSGKWVRLLHAATWRFRMEASIEGDWLVLWRCQTSGLKNLGNKKSEVLKYNLADLAAAGWPASQ